jgi:hypothetical protein
LPSFHRPSWPRSSIIIAIKKRREDHSVAELRRAGEEEISIHTGVVGGSCAKDRVARTILVAVLAHDEVIPAAKRENPRPTPAEYPKETARDNSASLPGRQEMKPLGREAVWIIEREEKALPTRVLPIPRTGAGKHDGIPRHGREAPENRAASVRDQNDRVRVAVAPRVECHCFEIIPSTRI